MMTRGARLSEGLGCGRRRINAVTWDSAIWTLRLSWVSGGVKGLRARGLSTHNECA